MRIGCLLLDNVVAAGPSALRRVAQAAEDRGYTRMVVPEHVLELIEALHLFVAAVNG